MKVLILVPLFVADALPPRPTTKAVRTALLPPENKNYQYYSLQEFQYRYLILSIFAILLRSRKLFDICTFVEQLPLTQYLEILEEF